MACRITVLGKIAFSRLRPECLPLSCQLINAAKDAVPFDSSLQLEHPAVACSEKVSFVQGYFLLYKSFC